MMADIPENCFASYMQESIKTLQMFTTDSIILVHGTEGRNTPTPTPTPIINPDIPNIPTASTTPNITISASFGNTYQVLFNFQPPQFQQRIRIHFST